MKQIKDKILEIADIAKVCPDNLQVVCFETLLKHYLTGLTQPPLKSPAEGSPKTTPAHNEAKRSPAETEEPANAGKQEDIKESDIHLKVKRFMEKEAVTLDQINNLFFKEGDRILPLFDNLKTTRMAESQIRITLLQSLVNALTTGEFQADVSAVKAECSQRKCLDASNFTANFRNNISFFDDKKIDRKTTSLKLSDPGRKELADVIKELQ